MVTSPFTGFEADYVAAGPTFDVRRTPSRTGLATELFRRMPDTIRSLHPTHPVAGWGERAGELLGEHHHAETFDERSPFCLMREYDGIVIGIGVGTRNAFTLVHSAEYLHPKARAHSFCAERRSLRIRDGDRTIDYTFRRSAAGSIAGCGGSSSSCVAAERSGTSAARGSS
jgi:aminoglycoside N3'-acetyltransferase